MGLGAAVIALEVIVMVPVIVRPPEPSGAVGVSESVSGSLVVV